MSKSRGKKFESEISKLLSIHPAVAYHYRPTDTPPSGHDRFTPRSPIDFYCYLQGGQGMVVECKAIKGKSLPHSRFSDHQWLALDKCARAGVRTYVLVNHYGWPGRDGARGKAYAVEFGVLRALRARGTRKSWALGDIAVGGLGKVGGGWEWELQP